MTLKNTILISTATYFVLDFILWAMGWLVWPIIFAALWFGAGHLSWLIEKNYARWRDNERVLNQVRVSHYAFGPFWALFGFLENKDKILKKINWLPSIRNPFIWPEKELDKQENKE